MRKRKRGIAYYAAATREEALRVAPPEVVNRCPGAPCAGCGREVVPVPSALEFARAHAAGLGRRLVVLCFGCARRRMDRDLARGRSGVVQQLSDPEVAAAVARHRAEKN